MCGITGKMRCSKYNGHVRLPESVFGRHGSQAICLQPGVHCLHPGGLLSLCFSEMLILIIHSLRGHIVQDVKANGQLDLTVEKSHLPLENFCRIPGLCRPGTSQQIMCSLV